MERWTEEDPRVLAIQASNVQHFATAKRATVEQIICALNRGVDPEGMSKSELSGAIDAAQEQADLVRMRTHESYARDHLGSLFPTAAADAFDDLPLQAAMSRITAREKELMDQFPVGTSVSFHRGDINGVITKYGPSNDARSIGMVFFITGVQGQFGVYNLVNASKTSDSVDPKAAEKEALRVRVTEKVEAVLREEPVDFDEAVKKTTTQVMARLTKGRRTDLGSITDGDIDLLIVDQRGRTY